MNTFVNDTFTGSAADLTAHSPETGGAWSRHPNLPDGVISLDGSGGAYISGGSVIGVSGALYINAASPNNADYGCESIISKATAISGQYAGIAIRVNVSATTYYSVVYLNDPGKWQLAKTVAGVYTALGTDYTDSWSSGSRTVKLTATGSALSVSIGGVERITATDTAITAKGKCGLLSYIDGAASTGMHYLSATATEADAPVLDHTPLFFVKGNSQTEGILNDLYDQLVPLLYGSPDTENQSTGGHTLADFRTEIATELPASTSGRDGRVVVLFFDATNSLGVGGMTDEEAYDEACAFAADCREAYPQAVVVGTTVPYRDFQGGGGYDPDPSDINDRIAGYNALMRANTLGRFDDVADVQELLGTDPSVYSTDLIHIDIEPWVGRTAALLADTVNPFLGGPVASGSSLFTGVIA